MHVYILLIDTFYLQFKIILELYFRGRPVSTGDRQTIAKRQGKANNFT